MKNVFLCLVFSAICNFCFSQTETFGSPTTPTPISSFTGWSNNLVSYSGTGDIRSTSPSNGSGGGNVFLNTLKDFIISGITTNGLSSGNLCFNIFKSTTSSDGSELRISYINATGPTSFTLPTGSGTAVWHNVCLNITFTSSPISITFVNTASTTLQFRLDDISITNTILPTRLSTFSLTHNGSKAKISWATQSEKANAYFVIQRSSDGYKFEDISRVEGSGNTEVSKTYSYIDNKPFIGDNYYRLKQVDFDGKESLFEVEHIFIPSSKGLTINNTLVTDILHLASDLENYEVKIFDIRGQKVWDRKEIFNDLMLDVSNWQTGHYFIQTNDVSGIKSIRFYKQ